MSDKHILVIEDDEAIQAITKFSLEIEDDWKVTTALCGKEGLIKAKSLHPDVILLDLVMPDINGIDILKELKSNQPTQKIPIILFTAKAVTINIPELQDGNIIGIITKPFDCLTLSAKIINILKNS